MALESRQTKWLLQWVVANCLVPIWYHYICKHRDDVDQLVQKWLLRGTDQIKPNNIFNRFEWYKQNLHLQKCDIFSRHRRPFWMTSSGSQSVGYMLDWVKSWLSKIRCLLYKGPTLTISKSIPYIWFNPYHDKEKKRKEKKRKRKDLFNVGYSQQIAVPQGLLSDMDNIT